MNNVLIHNKEQFIGNATEFLDIIFDSALRKELGEIEIRIFGPPTQYFFSSEQEAAEKAYDLCNKGIDVYFGVNPRTGKGGKKENVQWITSFHAEIDYGRAGHKKPPTYLTYDEALKAIEEFNPQPTLMIHSGGGFHCYWVLNDPLKVSAYGIEAIEVINEPLPGLKPRVSGLLACLRMPKIRSAPASWDFERMPFIPRFKTLGFSGIFYKTLSLKLGGDCGTQDISRVLRIPGTFNFKVPGNPRPVELISNSGKKYAYEDFQDFIRSEDFTKEKSSPKSCTTSSNSKIHDQKFDPIDIDILPVSERTKFLIWNGNDGTYISRSEVDFAVITALVNKGVSEDKIRLIFLDTNYQIGDKYRTHNAPDTYLNHTIEKAKEKSNLTEEEMLDPLFISGAIHKDDKGGYHLNVLKLEEYIVRKYRLKILDQEKAFFKYNGKCFEQLTADSLNALCQKEIKDHRKLFKESSLKEFIHYAVGDILVDSEKARNDQVNYLTLQNGLFKLDEAKLVPHHPEIFTTNLLPYDYDPFAKCHRFIQYLNEVFIEDQEKIHFIQEAVGYAFHKSIPTPVVFFLIGGGNNGKSVFINTLSNLVGKENTSNVSFNSMSDKHYIVQLFQKMINISGETPHTKQGNTDTIKAVISGDWVTGRDLYKNLMKFRPFAKHYLAMNKVPIITDNSHGMWRRILVIEFPRTFSEEEMDRNLEGKLMGELSGIFNWALEGYKRLKERDFKLTESPSMKLMKQDYRSEMDSVRAFANETLLKANGTQDKLRFGTAYQAYLSFCQQEGRTEPEKKGDFKKVLKDLGFKIENSKKDGNQVYIFNAKLVEVNE